MPITVRVMFQSVSFISLVRRNQSYMYVITTFSLCRYFAILKVGQVIETYVNSGIITFCLKKQNSSMAMQLYGVII